jgi:pimeloyl-ACP methyl ester carboxylesterase
LRAAARLYERVEDGVAAVLDGVARGVDRAAGAGLFRDAPGTTVTVVPARWSGGRLAGVADLVAAGAGLDGGRVRVVEVGSPEGGSAWVVIIPGTQRWSPRSRENPFDVPTDLRAVTGEATVAAAGVASALRLAQDLSDRRRRAEGSLPRRPEHEAVLLVGHSLGGILAAALAADPAFTAGQHVTHLLTTGSPVGVFPVPPATATLSVEHAEDPVPGLDLTPNPDRDSWHTVRVGAGPPVDLGRHALGEYVETVREAECTGQAEVTAWAASARGVLGQPVVAVTEVAVSRAPHR